MKYRLLNFLVCPCCKESFELKIYRETNGEIEDGELICKKCKKTYEINCGIPRILPDLLSESKEKTAKQFGWEWQNFSKMYKEYKKQFLNWIYPINQDFFRNKIVLDAGCGMGRLIYYSAKFGAKEVIGIDLSSAVDVAYEYTKDIPNAHIVQADIYNLPFKRDFDFIYCIGVLHHLPHPERGFRKLLEYLKPRGTVSAWVYGKEGNLLLKLLDPIRRHITSKMPLTILDLLSVIITLFLYPIIKLIYRPLNKLLTQRIVNHLPQNAFFYYLSDFRFRHIHLIIFDQFQAPIANYYTREEFGKWFTNADLKNIRISWHNRNSWKGCGELVVK